MRYFKFSYDNGVHTGAEDEYVEFDDNVTEEALNDYGVEALSAYAESYEYLASGWNEEDEEEYGYNEDDYYENCDFNYEEVTKEEYMENCEE
jgi:hypothetical protein